MYVAIALDLIAATFNAATVESLTVRQDGQTLDDAVKISEAP